MGTTDKLPSSSIPSISTIQNVPPNLKEILFNKFDDLVSKGQVFCQPYTNEYVSQSGFPATFQLAPHLKKKPIQAADDPSRKTGKGGSKNPFLDPDPSFVVTHVGEHHTLLLNKYCVYRPSAILHTKHFAQQADDLDESDLNAAMAVLHALEKSDDDDNDNNNYNNNKNNNNHETETNGEPNERKRRTTPKWMMIFNCGVNSGSSQGHKHMQLWPYQSPQEIGFELFPEKLLSLSSYSSDNNDDNNNDNDTPEPLTDKSLPFAQFTLPLTRPSSPSSSVNNITQAYSILQTRVQTQHVRHNTGQRAYNVHMTVNSVTLIPRTHSGIEYQAGSNTAGMLGLIWISDVAEKDIWMRDARGDLKGYLEYLGVPNT